MDSRCFTLVCIPYRSHTRYKPWPRVEEFLRELEACSLVADAGCGNGETAALAFMARCSFNCAVPATRSMPLLMVLMYLTQRLLYSSYQ